MNLETIPPKHLADLERLTRELLDTMRKAKVRDQALIEQLRGLESAVEKVRRERYDAVNPEFRGY